MNEELEKRLRGWADFLDEGDYSNAPDHARDDRKAAAKLKAQRERIKALEYMISILAPQHEQAEAALAKALAELKAGREEIARLISNHDHNVIVWEQIKSDRDKALADVEGLEKALVMALKHWHLYGLARGSDLGLTNDAEGPLYREAKAALKGDGE